LIAEGYKNMSQAHYLEAPLRAPTKQGINVITEMPTRRIVGHLTYKHRVGLLAFIGLVGWNLTPPALWFWKLVYLMFS
jgi:hypothetical protein